MYKYLTAICLAFSSIHAAQLQPNAKDFLTNHVNNEFNAAFNALSINEVTAINFISQTVIPYFSSSRGTPYQVDSNNPSIYRGEKAVTFDELLFKMLKEYLPSDRSGALLDYACGDGLQAFLSAMLFAFKHPHTVTAADPYMTQNELNYINEKKQQLAAFLKLNDGQTPLTVLRSNISDFPNMAPKYDVITLRDAAHLFTPLQMRDFFQKAFTNTTENGHIIIGAITQGANFRAHAPIDWNTFFAAETPDETPHYVTFSTKMGPFIEKETRPMTNFTKLFSASQAAGWTLGKASFPSKYIGRGEIIREQAFSNPNTEVTDFRNFIAIVFNSQNNHPDIFYDRVYLLFKKLTNT